MAVACDCALEKVTCGCDPRQVALDEHLAGREERDGDVCAACLVKDTPGKNKATRVRMRDKREGEEREGTVEGERREDSAEPRGSARERGDVRFDVK